LPDTFDPLLGAGRWTMIKTRRGFAHEFKRAVVVLESNG